MIVNGLGQLIAIPLAGLAVGAVGIRATGTLVGAVAVVAALRVGWRRTAGETVQGICPLNLDVTNPPASVDGDR